MVMKLFLSRCMDEAQEMAELICVMADESVKVKSITVVFFWFGIKPSYSSQRAKPTRRLSAIPITRPV